MKNLNYFSILRGVFLLLVTFSTYALGIETATTPFPFLNIMLNPQNSVQSNYSFRDSSGNTHPLIFCYQSNGGSANSGIATLTWPYKGKINSGDMSVNGTLKINANYEGSFADFNGTLTITNNSNAQIFVNCQYGF